MRYDPSDDLVKCTPSHDYMRFAYWDQGCCCVGCISGHNAYAEAHSVGKNYRLHQDQFQQRIYAMRDAGWKGRVSAWIPEKIGLVQQAAVVAGWSKDGYVCKKCNSRNPYAGPEHLRDGVYICYECK